ncbi:hypothetical protein EYF80_022653 [Liparis tanakae]|uniref:Uncharacterized protein n=1 Tax=Liparis tanakae TaxID=230148 RepID=A0A4Z2HQ46_9TELE|nr:hypothetical protein EYF80_022653 [Liparis tanakae]
MQRPLQARRTRCNKIGKGTLKKLNRRHDIGFKSPPPPARRPTWSDMSSSRYRSGWTIRISCCSGCVLNSHMAKTRSSSRVLVPNSKAGPCSPLANLCVTTKTDDVSAARSPGRVAPVRGWWIAAATHLFEQREDVDGEEAQGGGDHEAGLLLQALIRSTAALVRASRASDRLEETERSMAAGRGARETHSGALEDTPTPRTRDGLNVGAGVHVAQLVDHRQTQGVDPDPSLSYRERRRDVKIREPGFIHMTNEQSSAAWKQARDESARESSMDIWTAKAESGFTLARDSRSVERTKKLPWNVWMDKPEGASWGEK